MNRMETHDGIRKTRWRSRGKNMLNMHIIITETANNFMNSRRTIFYCNLGADLSLTEGVLFSLIAAFSISASRFDLLE